MPILNANTVEFFSRSPEQTRRLGMRIGSQLKKGDILCLTGDLGAGKTTLVKGIAQGWGSLEDVTSPTFVIVNIYRKPDGASMYHMDAYRLQNAFEAEDLDIEQMIEDGILVIEWPGHIDEALPQDRLTIDMQWMTDQQRKMLFQHHGERYEKILADFRLSAFGG